VLKKWYLHTNTVQTPNLSCSHHGCTITAKLHLTLFLLLQQTSLVVHLPGQQFEQMPPCIIMTAFASQSDFGDLHTQSSGNLLAFLE